MLNHKKELILSKFSIVLSFLLLVFGGSVSAQGEGLPMPFLKITGPIPTDLLVSPTAVIVTPMDEQATSILQQNNGDIPRKKELISRFHNAASEAGLFPSFYVDARFFTGPESNFLFTSKLKEEGIKYILMIKSASIISNMTVKAGFEILVAEYNGQASIFDYLQPTYRIQSEGFALALEDLKAALVDLKRGENTAPEATTIQLKKLMNAPRKNYSPPYLEKSLIVLHELNKIPIKEAVGISPKEIYKHRGFSQYNESTDKWNTEIKTMLTQAKLPYQVVSGFQDTLTAEQEAYHLVSLVTPDNAAKTLLSPAWKSYEEDYSVAASSKVLSLQSGAQNYYYFYFKNAKTGDIYFRDYGDFQDPIESFKAFSAKMLK